MALEEFRARIPLNWDLLGNPVNWIIVFLMLAFAGLAVRFIGLQSGATDDQGN